MTLGTQHQDENVCSKCREVVVTQRMLEHWAFAAMTTTKSVLRVIAGLPVRGGAAGRIRLVIEASGLRPIVPGM